MKCFLFLVALMCFSDGLLYAQADSETAIQKDEALILEAAKSYQEAFNSKNVEKLVEHFTPAAEMETGGQVLRGRDAIKQDFEALFAEGKTPKLELTQLDIDMISPGVAIETGVAILTRPDGTESVPYRAVHVKKSAGWMVDRVQDEEPVELPPSNYERLKALEWLVGVWTLDVENSQTTISCRWTSNRNFLVQSYSVSGENGVELEGTQVIGWDPSLNKVRSWLFDSDGGFGSGAWTAEPNGWRVQTLQVVPDGKKATSTNVYEIVDENTFRYSSIGRQVGGQLLKNISAARFIRK